MNHKRRRPKHQRRGCLWCKPQKDERRKKEPRKKRELVALAARPEQVLAREY